MTKNGKEEYGEKKSLLQRLEENGLTKNDSDIIGDFLEEFE